ncbi:MAG TPA: hypothetical protein VNU01_01515 [Egibacteraceae bacterium]|nr:hypothetical protein [Egibacteraceae bacterium]
MDPFDEPGPDSDEDGPPLVMERLRKFGWVAVVLAPLLVITLAQISIGVEWAIIVFVGGLVAITAWRQREDG